VFPLLLLLLENGHFELFFLLVIVPG
jgi:hypothetical protein